MRKTDLEIVQEQLAHTTNDPNLVIRTCCCTRLILEENVDCRACPVMINFNREHPMPPKSIMSRCSIGIYPESKLIKGE